MNRPVVALVLLLIASVAHSESAQKCPDAEIFRFAFSKSDYAPPARASPAQLYLTYCRTMAERIPSNTPAEEEWVGRECLTSDIKKVTRLVRTKEWARS